MHVCMCVLACACETMSVCVPHSVTMCVCVRLCVCVHVCGGGGGLMDVFVWVCNRKIRTGGGGVGW